MIPPSALAPFSTVSPSISRRRAFFSVCDKMVGWCGCGVIVPVPVRLLRLIMLGRVLGLYADISTSSPRESRELVLTGHCDGVSAVVWWIDSSSLMNVAVISMSTNPPSKFASVESLDASGYESLYDS